MSIQVIILMIAVVFIIFLMLSFSKSTAFDNFIKQKNHIFHNINKWVKKDMDSVLQPIMKPMSKNCIKKTYTLEALQELRAKNRSIFKHLLQCGYIHNLFVLTALSIWEDFSKLHTENSLNLFIQKLIVPVTSADYFKKLDYLQTKKSIRERINEYGL